MSTPACAPNTPPPPSASTPPSAPLLRDLGQSVPCFHNGAAPDLATVIAQHVQVAALARAKQLRNPDPELLKMRIDASDIDPLVAFLRALDEDYN